MMCRSLLTLLFLATACVSASPAAAQWTGVSAALANGYAWAYVCNRKIDLEVAEGYLQRTMGTDAHYSNAELVTDMLLVITSIGIARQMVPAGCDGALRSYGPDGTLVRGLLK
ncbi:MAG TPA: hypothetical protein VFW23_04135 [Tepidisphaeraceae bacterium]|nr:hypothetical protein [Tepidisphaeraceae bacterium]